MREMLIYTILFLFCFIPVAAQQVSFEGLHLDDLISVPGEHKPGTDNHFATSFELPDFKLLSPGKLLTSRIPYPLLPRMAPVRFPRANNLHAVSFLKLSGKLGVERDYFSSASLPVETYSAYSVRSDVYASYRLANKLSFYLSTHYISDRYRTPRSLYTRGIGSGVSYQFSDKIQLKSGISYQYNTVFRKWEWMYLMGVIFSF